MSKIRIIYKSGAEVVMECDSFTTQRSGLSGELVGIKWENATPEPLHAGVSDIAAIWQIE